MSQEESREAFDLRRKVDDLIEAIVGYTSAYDDEEFQGNLRLDLEGLMAAAVQEAQASQRNECR